MKKKVDFIIRYEHKVRELESIVLLRLELERRGYSVAFVGNYESEDKISYRPKVLVAPAIYSNNQLRSDWVKYGAIKKIANLQWEQLLGIKEEEDLNDFHIVKEVGQRVVNFCWGKKPHERIVRGGVNPNMAPIVGHINTDLLRGEFKKLLLSKVQLADKYSLDSEKKWYLFISSFAYCDMDDAQRKLCIEALGLDGFNRFTDLSYKSREAILDWFESLLNQDLNIVVIYRPHPDETEKCERLKKMTKKYSNFKVIPSEALKHWINASDKVYNWFSTGIVDAITMRKTYRLLRPVQIDEALDYRMMHSAESIGTEEGFIADKYDLDYKEVIPMNLFNSYYFFTNEFVYLKLCDFLEELLNTNKYDVKYTISEKCSIICMYHIHRISDPIKKLMLKIPTKFYPSLIKKRIVARKEYISLLNKGYEKNVATEEEIKEIAKRLTPIIYGQEV